MWRARPAFALCATVRLPAGLEPARGKPASRGMPWRLAWRARQDSNLRPSA